MMNVDHFDIYLIHNVQDSEYVGFVDKDNYYTMLENEQYDDEMYKGLHCLHE